MVNFCDFKVFVVVFEDCEVFSKVMIKWCGQFYEIVIGQLLLDVVVWYGNYVFYKYDLCIYCFVGVILFDYFDLLIFIVLIVLFG